MKNKTVKMYFPKGICLRGLSEFKEDAVNEVPNNPASIKRWEIRGCTLVKEETEVTKEEKKEAEVTEAPVKEEVKEEPVKEEPVKEEKPKNKKNKK